MSDKKSVLSIQKLFLCLKVMCMCFYDEGLFPKLILSRVLLYLHCRSHGSMKNNLYLMSIGKIIQEKLLSQSSPFTKSPASTSSSSPNPSLVLSILMNKVIEGDINTKSNGLHIAINKFIKGLLKLELKD